MTRRMRYGHRSIAAALVGAAVVVAGSACNVKQELLSPQNPAVIGPDQVGSPTAADALRKGVYSRLRGMTAGADGAWDDAGLMTDEWKSSNTFSQHQELDSRSIALNDAEVASVYATFQAARGAAYTAVIALNQYLPTPVYLAQMWFVLGYAELELGDDFCNGIPLGQTDRSRSVAIYASTFPTIAKIFGIARLPRISIQR